MKKEIIKTEKEIIEDAFIKKRSFGVRNLPNKDQIIFNEDKSLDRKWRLIK